MHNNDDNLNSSPMYVYQRPMCLLTVSVVIIIENGVLLMADSDGVHRFPGGIVRAGLETIQFAAVRYVKEQTGLLLKKGDLMPIDFRSDPDRSIGGNIIDIGFLCFKDGALEPSCNAKWKEVDFENGCMTKKINFYMDHDVLLERAIEFSGIVKA